MPQTQSATGMPVDCSGNRGERLESKMIPVEQKGNVYDNYQISESL